MTGDSSNTTLKGFTARRILGGAYNTGGLNVYPIANGYATAIGNGDPVKLSAGTIQIAVNTKACLGILQSVSYVDSDSRLQYRKDFLAATSSYNLIRHNGSYTQPIAFVYDNPNQTYTLQSIASVSAGLLGKSYKVSAIGSIVNGRSQCVLDIHASAGTSGGHMATIIGLWSGPSSNWDNATTVVEVKLSNQGIVGEL